MSTGGTAIYQARVQNDTKQSCTFMARAAQSAGIDWTVYKRGTTNISTALRSTAGYKGGVLTPGASEIITVEMTPNSGASTSKSTTLRVFLGGTDTVTRDTVKVVATVTADAAPGYRALQKTERYKKRMSLLAEPSNRERLTARGFAQNVAEAVTTLAPRRVTVMITLANFS